MTTVVLSPHTDDAVFSIGAHLSTLNDVTIATVFAGIPDDPAGHTKHTRLRAEHTEACQVIGAAELNSDLLDDVYPPSTPEQVLEFITAATKGADTVYIPLGIRHPDHVAVANAAIEILHTMNRVRFYKELPYGVDYPHLVPPLVASLHHLGEPCGHTMRSKHYVTVNATVKRRAVDCYTSQIDDSLIKRVMHPEQIWEIRW